MNGFVVLGVVDTLDAIIVGSPSLSPGLIAPSLVFTQIAARMPGTVKLIAATSEGTVD